MKHEIGSSNCDSVLGVFSGLSVTILPDTVIKKGLEVSGQSLMEVISLHLLAGTEEH
jgi:hypothetical protein